ncbi:hypothetical protein G4G93_32775 [Methylobacterium sp. DB0501]|uniref:hypothetical protein n=1 Tax=Methylobacterium sp. DB0501 TaxID=2709665 RepID=UPI0013ECAA3D|nr:hypothetical protein [Methylobacterium sp. DB0501]NGM38615.1 hypothetical protein [Methylobacterium sp. DB0501]
MLIYNQAGVLGAQLIRSGAEGNGEFGHGRPGEAGYCQADDQRQNKREHADWGRPPARGHHATHDKISMLSKPAPAWCWSGPITVREMGEIAP